MCRCVTFVYSCRHRRQGNTYVCRLALQPDRPRGWWSVLCSWWTGKKQRSSQKCQKITTDRQFIPEPCRTCCHLYETGQLIHRRPPELPPPPVASRAPKDATAGGGGGGGGDNGRLADPPAPLSAALANPRSFASRVKAAPAGSRLSMPTYASAARTRTRSRSRSQSSSVVRQQTTPRCPPSVSRPGARPAARATTGHAAPSAARRKARPPGRTAVRATTSSVSRSRPAFNASAAQSSSSDRLQKRTRPTSATAAAPSTAPASSRRTQRVPAQAGPAKTRVAKDASKQASGSSCVLNAFMGSPAVESDESFVCVDARHVEQSTRP
ncbi:hypothetical protein SPI_00294 [Niveomyces insectorum RCEF 264]|uniref:Uncharacterized protein n=1 Tax=Niveomyces insectorum RCEF 264 TaxID=1081102 RepID=A0A168A0G0_9HYPO|nr:hypothetical protein SPI_00294 [Niveomyces insectorum RCEF 264]